MENDLIKINYKQERVGIKTFKTKFIAEITHTGLNDHKLLSSDDRLILQNKVDVHIIKIKEKWEQFVEKRDLIKGKQKIENDSLKKAREAKRMYGQIENILVDAINNKKKDYWNSLKKNKKFNLLYPEKLPLILAKPEMQQLSNVPTIPPILQPTQVKISFLAKLIKSKRDLEIKKAIDKNIEVHNRWIKIVKEVEIQNNKHLNLFKENLKKYETEIENQNDNFKKEIELWELKKMSFENNQEISNSKIDLLKAKYLKLDSNALVEYCALILKSADYPPDFPNIFEVDYNNKNKILIIEYSLPSIAEIPTLKDVKFISNESKEIHFTESQILKMFDDIIYQITLKSIFILFNSDVANALTAISFNGWVNAVNKGTGKRENNCILSIIANKKEFMEIDLLHVDAKSCFKLLKGVSSSKLSGLTAIQPILQISRTDKRFTNHYGVAHTVDNSTNLASMDWEDFEHLIREVFAQEFSSNGGEVKVTRASRDGGVDAIAFDPDPIRGGKIVIQAKRYTNTVGVSAVRDLYGTVLNEGATKGILVTTADYGPDAYEFVKGKPLTLLNGSNLLHLLERHGHKARINIKEARENMK